MMPFIAGANAAAAAVCAVLAVFCGFDWTLFTGLLAGNLLMLANFVLIGVTAEKAVKCKDFRRARSISGISYGLRYSGIFAILAVLLTFRLVSVVTAVIPLFYPKIYYTFFYALKRGKDEET